MDLYQQIKEYLNYFYTNQKFIPYNQKFSLQKKDKILTQPHSLQEKQVPLNQKKPFFVKPSPSFAIKETTILKQKQSSLSLDSLYMRMHGCQDCNLCLNRKNIVFGQGNHKSKILIIGEAPGQEEDKEGFPFIGRAGQLLNRMLLGICITRESIYITNIVKCRPPQNRNPHLKEMNTCSKFLKEQIRILEPRFIILLGTIAFQWIFPQQGGIMKNHGKTFSYQFEGQSIPVIPTFHPAYLLRKPLDLILAWQDFRKIRQAIFSLGLFHSKA